MSLSAWTSLNDPYDHEQLADNFIKLDQHNHTPGQGAPIGTTSLGANSVTTAKLANNALFNSGLFSAIGLASAVPYGFTYLATDQNALYVNIAGTWTNVTATQGLTDAPGNLSIGGTLGVTGAATFSTIAATGNITSPEIATHVYSILSSGSIAAGDSVVASNGINVSLPSSPVNGNVVKVFVAPGNFCTVVATGGKIIGGSGVLGLSSVSIGSYIELLYNSTLGQWVIIGGGQDTGWLNISSVPSGYQNSWTDYTGSGGSGYTGAVAQYRKIGNGVRFRGALTGGTSGSLAFTLPTGFAPTHCGLAFATSLSVAGELLITTGGAVNPFYSGTPAFYPIDCSFLVD